MILSPTTTGDDMPLGTATFHFTFLVGPISTGGFCPSATAEPPGPRNCGHAGSPASPTAANTPTAANASNRFMFVTSIVGVDRPRRDVPELLSHLTGKVKAPLRERPRSRDFDDSCRPWSHSSTTHVPSPPPILVS